ncbi:type II toxin-antitoxin system Phd/YefM family antitoxin [Taklimakanibacter lacteus]|uniref:type II toxin-antitoxin system Phd/YefM family antitoxin n=1 Tax=Taklimakanibacter lacteus TaxID=2268456 RepID=UPI000E663040
MRVTYMTSASFNQNPSKAKKEADERPLVITDHGEAAYVLMRYAEFEANWKKPKSLFDALRDPKATAEGDFAPERLTFDDRDASF